MFNKGLVIGTSGIGKAHVREFINFGIRKVALFGKSYKKNRVKKTVFNNIKKVKIFNLKNFNEIKKFKPDIVSICSPTNLHLRHLNRLKKFCKNFIIEKPFFWEKKNNNYLKAKRVFNENLNIIVNLPMINLANQVLRKEKIKKVKEISFRYLTKGKNTHQNIPIDLLPHALSFSLILLRRKVLRYQVLSVKMKKYTWKCKIMLNNVLCKYYFNQNINKKNSNLDFSINNNFYQRKQKNLLNFYTNTFLKNKKKIIYANNPMSEILRYNLKNFKKKNIKNNNRLVLETIRISENLISQ